MKSGHNRTGRDRSPVIPGGSLIPSGDAEPPRAEPLRRVRVRRAGDAGRLDAAVDRLGKTPGLDEPR